MNNSMKKKINTAGLIGYIISILLIIAMIACLVGTCIAAVGVGVISDEDVNVKTSTNINVTASGDILSKLDSFIKIDGVEELGDLSEGGKAENLEDSDLSELSVEKSENGIKVNALTNEVTFSAKRLIFALVITAVYLLAIVIMLYMIKAFMKALKSCDTPFADNVIRPMQKFGYSLIPVVVLSMINNSAWEGFINSSSFDFSINIEAILVLAVVFILIMVFKYGAELQKQSDETL